ncbi:MAG: pyruvate formate lyase activating enzyme [Patescibacteria group bacterium]|nr:pyruvate formate lyase activating enzyme [Patescibacteria group bacterium]
MRCRFCHNPEFVLPERVAEWKDDAIPVGVFLRFLDSRKGFLDGVVVCGGEPTLHGDLPELLKEIKARGFLVKLDTNGSRPEMVRAVIESGLVDYFAMDVKHSSAKYERLCGPGASFEKTIESARIVIESGVDHEFRTTVAKGEHEFSDIEEIARALMGARRYFLQNYRPGGVLDRAFHGASFTAEELALFAARAREFVPTVKIRP